MTGIHIDATQLNQLAADLGHIAGGAGAKAAAALKKTAFAIERDAKEFCPVDTGNLRSSISTSTVGDGRFKSMSAEIGPTADYGAFVELGTSRMAPAAYMGPAYDRNAHVLETALLSLADDL